MIKEFVLVDDCDDNYSYRSSMSPLRSFPAYTAIQACFCIRGVWKKARGIFLCLAETSILRSA